MFTLMKDLMIIKEKGEYGENLYTKLLENILNSLYKN